MIARPNAEIVSGGRIDVQLGGYARPFQGKVSNDAELGAANEIIAAVRQEHRRGPGRDVQPRASSSLSLALR